MLEVELSHNTCVKNLVVNNVLFDALVSKFFTLYGEFLLRSALPVGGGR